MYLQHQNRMAQEADIPFLPLSPVVPSLFLVISLISCSPLVAFPVCIKRDQNKFLSHVQITQLKREPTTQIILSETKTKQNNMEMRSCLHIANTKLFPCVSTIQVSHNILVIIFYYSHYNVWCRNPFCSFRFLKLPNLFNLQQLFG